MALKDLVSMTKEVKVNDSVSFTVRGLSTEDLAVLVEAHGSDVDKLMEGGGLEGIIRKSPSLVAEVIAIASDEPGSVDVAAKLPFGVQLAALKEIYDLTFPDEELVGKLAESLFDVIQRLRDRLALEKQEKIEKKETGEKS